MEYFAQSPKIIYSGEKLQSPYGWGKAIRTHELEAAINCCLGQKDMAMLKIMYFLTGNAEGFAVSEKTILERCNISESGYKNARKKLIEKDWIFHKQGEYIQVNFNKIFSDYNKLRAGSSQNTRISGSTNGTLSVREPSEVFPEENRKVIDKTQGGYPDNTHNNINNNINHNSINRISNKISPYCEKSASAAANAAASTDFSQPLRGRNEKTEKIKRAEKNFRDEWNWQYNRIAEKYNGANEPDDIQRLLASAEYKELQRMADKERMRLRDLYGDAIDV